MKTTLATLGIFGILVWASGAQEYRTPVASNATGTNNATPDIPKLLQGDDYATLNRREVESKAQFELLTQLAQEHKKRAEQTPRDQARSQWESELAKELGERASAILSLLNKTRKELSGFEEAHPELAGSAPPNSVNGATRGPSAEETAFLGALAARRTAVEQEIVAASEAANLYAIQLATNNTYSDISSMQYLIRDNGYYVKQLQKELFDLELKDLEFRALRKK